MGNFVQGTHYLYWNHPKTSRRLLNSLCTQRLFSKLECAFSDQHAYFWNTGMRPLTVAIRTSRELSVSIIHIERCNKKTFLSRFFPKPEVEIPSSIFRCTEGSVGISAPDGFTS